MHNNEPRTGGVNGKTNKLTPPEKGDFARLISNQQTRGKVDRTEEKIGHSNAEAM